MVPSDKHHSGSGIQGVALPWGTEMPLVDEWLTSDAATAIQKMSGRPIFGGQSSPIMPAPRTNVIPRLRLSPRHVQKPQPLDCAVIRSVLQRAGKGIFEPEAEKLNKNSLLERIASKRGARLAGRVLTSKRKPGRLSKGLSVSVSTRGV